MDPITLTTLNNSTDAPIFGRVTQWSSELAILFGFYSIVTVICILVYFIGRCRKIKRARREHTDEGEALVSINHEDEHLISSSHHHRDLGSMNPFVFLWNKLRLGPNELVQACGVDGYLFLRFEQHVIAALVFCTVFGLGVLIPVYVSGDGIVGGTSVSPDTTLQFERLTALNLSPGDSKLWAVLASVALNSTMMLAIVLRLYRVHRSAQRPPHLSIRDFTVHIGHLPKTIVDDDSLRKMVHEIVGEDCAHCVVAMDLKHLHARHKSVKRALAELERAREHNAGRGSRLKWCGKDAERYWEGEKERLKTLLKEEREAKERSGCGHAYVTFGRLQAAHRFVKSMHAMQQGHVRMSREHEARTATLQWRKWKVEMAPHPRDLVYANLGTGTVERVARAVVINVLLAVSMIFFTTPISLIAVLSDIAKADVLSTISTKLAAVFGFFGNANTAYGILSSTLMVIFTYILPRVLMWTARAERHHTRSHTEMSVVRKMFAYLFLSIIVMPSIFMTSVDVLFKIALSKDGGWEILRDLGGVFPRALFFINYLLAVGLVSNFFELLNFPGVFIAWWRTRRALTAYDRRRAQKASRARFLLGYEYAYQMVLLSMTLLFSTVVPVLVPFGLFAFFGKHIVDRINLTTVYEKPHTNTKIVRIVLSQVVIGTSFYIVAMFSFFLFSKHDQLKAILAGLMLVPCVCVGIYVRFWASASTGSIRYDFDEEDVFLPERLARESYQDPILTHDVVKEFYAANEHF